MDKQEFEQKDGGIKKGDLVLIVEPHSLFSDTHTCAVLGLYDPIEDEQHWYIHDVSRTGIVSKESLLPLINNAFIIVRTPTIDKTNLPIGIHDFGSSGPFRVRYADCKYVKLLLKSSELEQILYQHK